MPMGARSRLVLEKLGFDLRAYYEDLLAEPVPGEMRTLIYRLAGSPPEIIELGAGTGYRVEGERRSKRWRPPPQVRSTSRVSLSSVGDFPVTAALT